MPRFTLICDHSCDLDTHVVTHEFTAEQLTDVLMNLDMFLKGSGYMYDGVVDIADDESVKTSHSPYYFDTGRNR
jgi:hypothetical protein